MNPQQRDHIQRRLRIIQWAAWIDLILLIVLLTAAFTHQQNAVHILGPLHGINFLLLAVLVATGALDGLWSWWFPAAILFTAGAPGALVGEWILKRRITAQTSVQEEEHTLPGEQSESRNPSFESGVNAQTNTGELQYDRRKEDLL